MKKFITNDRTRTPTVAIMFMRFAGMGIIGTIAHYALLIFLVEVLGTRPVLGSSSGFLLGAAVNYALNYRYTFASRKQHIETMPKFYLIAAVGFVFNGLIVHALADGLELNYLLAQLVATALVLVWGFTANYLWTFVDKSD